MTERPATETVPATDEGATPEERATAEERATMGRILRFAAAGWALLAIGYAIRGEWWALVGLTCSGSVVMINFLWLEGILVRVLQPAPRINAWRLGVRALARFLLLGVALAVSIFVVRFNPLSVLFGFSILVFGIGCEVLYAAIRAGGKAA